MHTKKRFGGRPLIIAAALLLVIGIGGFAAWRTVDSRNNANTDLSTDTDGKADNEQDIDYSPATDEDKKANDEHKDDIVKQQEQEAQNPTPSATVTPVITTTGQYGSDVEVSASVSGVVEDGGICTLTATKGANKVTKQTTGVRNAQNTSCPTFIIPRSEFAAAGDWNTVVTYKSTGYTGTSQSKVLEIK